ncbi:cellulose binding domain-containing protein [Saccharothrix luteola]|jgi:chitin-binding protein|uniref:cellulose binding domain-containing protein n=1 Tax=Saccharothrix luteola TaxID=2893018 RepID=UPI001E5FEE3F|nr:cellulose binding domain-containing protein [Saccharothrix luteola]MCC8242802.1 cellulose-binding domain-containing protein [Saccharothrix luteola]
MNTSARPRRGSTAVGLVLTLLAALAGLLVVASQSGATAQPSPTNTSSNTHPTDYPPSSTTTPTPTGRCTAVYRLVGTWPGGLLGEVVVTAGSPITTWNVQWTLAPEQEVTNLWGGVAYDLGRTANVRNAHWNGALAPQATATIGFTVSGSPHPHNPMVSCLAS